MPYSYVNPNGNASTATSRTDSPQNRDPGELKSEQLDSHFHRVDLCIERWVLASFLFLDKQFIGEQCYNNGIAFATFVTQREISKLNPDKNYKANVIVVGGGIAGIVTSLELLDHGKSVLILDRNSRDNFGGQALTAFGGMTIVGSPLQKRLGVKDTPEIALHDWLNTAEFDESDVFQKKWAEMYCHRSLTDVFDWVRKRGVGFLPSVMWPERGYYGQGNSLPRYHIVWGTGYGCTSTLIKHLISHENKDRLQLCFNHRATNIEKTAGKMTGVTGEMTDSGGYFCAESEAVVIASGGLGGDLKRVRELWPEEMGRPPKELLIGSHPFCDGAGLDLARRMGGVLTNLGYMWNYPDSIANPNPEYENQGIRVIPPKSALWMDYRGRRFGPEPLIGYFDTAYCVKRICRQRKKYSWHILNWKIAKKELALGGAEFNEAIRDKKIVSLLKNSLFGNTTLIQRMINESSDFITANSVSELARKMNELVGNDDVDTKGMELDIKRYDQQIDRGAKLFNDSQLLRITNARNWSGDKIRTCKFQKIVDPKAMPLLAIRYRVMTRKCLGGIQTDLKSRVVDKTDEPIPGLYAVGEAAGFGGGGINGKSSLEGTFISSCILSGRIAARSIAGVPEP